MTYTNTETRQALKRFKRHSKSQYNKMLIATSKAADDDPALDNAVLGLCHDLLNVGPSIAADILMALGMALIEEERNDG